MSDLAVAAGFPNGIAPVPFDHAVKRVTSFCCSHLSGWQSYDRAGEAARAAGHFNEVAPWSLLWADALAGRISVGDLDRFTLKLRKTFAQLISKVPVDKDLADFDEPERRTVHDLCMFGYRGVWAPKSTKVSSLYRPRAVPVLDGYVAMAFGFKRAGFSEGREARWNRISRVIDAMATWLDANRDQMIDLREAVRATVSDIDVVSDLRLLDMVIWCSQDDALERAGKKRNAWLEASPRPYSPQRTTAIPVTKTSRP